MEPQHHLDSVTADSEAIAAVAATGADAEVGACPGWNVADLVRHVGRIHRWVTLIVSDRLQEFVRYPKIEDAPAGGADLAAWFRMGADDLIATLASTNPAEPVWNWADGEPAPARFWFRRMAHETAIHRWDAQDAVGEAEPLSAEVALDGVDEFLDIWLRRAGDGLAGAGETIHLHATDGGDSGGVDGGGGEWLIRLAGSETTVTREHAKGDVAARGLASDLNLLLWNRTDPAAVEVFGDGELLQRFCGSLRI